MIYSSTLGSSFDNRSASNILNAIELLRARWQGTAKSYWNVVKLSPNDYSALWQKLESEEKELANYIQDYVRSNYDPATFQFSVPMPSAVHEHLLESIRCDLFEQLSSIRNDSSNPATGLAKTFHPGASTTIFFEDGGHRSPDMQFTYHDRKYPSLIIEIAYSQSEKSGSLPELADEYIVESGGNILLVIGVEIPYRSQKMGTISTWCPKFGTDDEGEYVASQQKIISQAFLNVDGIAVSGTTLRIPFRSFTPESIRSKFLPEALDEELVLSYEKLAMYLEFAEGLDGIRKTGQAVIEPLTAGKRKQRRLATPLETLSVEHEDRSARQESAEERRAEEQDGDWHEQ